MKIEILQTGSKGNATILTDKAGNQLLIDAGLKYDKIARRVKDFGRLTVVCTHEHGDHSLSLARFETICETISPKNAKSGMLIKAARGAWDILPIAVPHGSCLCFAYIIVNQLEHKKILWATDLTELPRIASPSSYDLFAIECNYELDKALDAVTSGKIKSDGYVNHLEANTLKTWLDNQQGTPKDLCIIHLSNSGLISRSDLPLLFKHYCRRGFYIGDKSLTFEV